MMIDKEPLAGVDDVVTLWLDPVCPFSWNTARWLMDAADKVGFSLELRLMNLAVLNEGHQLPPPQQAHMRDSRKAGRLMAAVRDEAGDALVAAYFAFGQLYFDQSASVDGRLVAHVARAAGMPRITAAVLADATWDAAVRQSHEASQQALGDVGGSPLVTIGGHTVFGPVLSAVPDADRTVAVFEAVTALVATPQFSQLQRPRIHP
jgi:predicted DsbA family dithiol-disulfide isomerase